MERLRLTGDPHKHEASVTALRPQKRSNTWVFLDGNPGGLSVEGEREHRVTVLHPNSPLKRPLKSSLRPYFL